jgi:heat shock protein HslJ
MVLRAATAACSFSAMGLRLASALVVLLAACGGAGGNLTAPAGQAGAPVPAGEFVLEMLDGAPFAARATLVLGPGDTVSGQGPCNRWSAPLAGPLPAFRLGPVVATEMACADLAAEAAFFAALAATTRAELTGDRLVLSGAEGAELVFRARGATPQP